MDNKQLKIFTFLKGQTQNKIQDKCHETVRLQMIKNTSVHIFRRNNIQGIQSKFFKERQGYRSLQLEGRKKRFSKIQH